jgi:hypothetical protein
MKTWFQAFAFSQNSNLYRYSEADFDLLWNTCKVGLCTLNQVDP